MHTVGTYRVLTPIGAGGRGTLFTAYDSLRKQLVALRIVSGEGSLTEQLKARFYQEAQAWAKLNHPNIARVLDLAEDEGQLLLVMEPLEGEELAGLIAQQRPFRLEDKLSLMIQVCDALHYAHEKGTIHGNLNPGNILVLQNGQVKILDFGLAGLMHAAARLTRTGLLMGNPRYMSPEHARGRVDQRSDIFSVAVVFYELLVFRPAFDSDDPMEILDQLRWDNPALLTEMDPTIPPDLAAIIERALRKDPDRRFPSLAEMRAALEFARRRLVDDALLAALAEYFPRVRELRLTQPPDVALVGETPSMTDDTTEGTQPGRSARVPRGRVRGFAKVMARLRGWRGHEAAIAAGVLLALGLGVNQALRPGNPPSPPPKSASVPQSMAPGDAATAAVRFQMLAARDGAAEAKARWLVPRFWASAAEKEREAETALGRQDFDRAGTLFMEAGNAYHEAWRRSATLAAIERERLVGLRRAARAAELAAESARWDAEQAGASRYAPTVLLLAREKEMEARAVSDRQDYVLIERRFRNAQQEYQHAAVEARLVSSKGFGQLLLAALRRLVPDEPELRGNAVPILWEAHLAERR